MEINLNRVTPGYFPAMSLAPIDGRLFESRDAAGAPAVAIVNETMARRFWNGRRAVGQTFMLGDQALMVVGVVPDITYRQLREPRRVSFYLSAMQARMSGGAFHVLTHGPADRLVETLRHTLANVDPAVPVSRALGLRAQADLHVTKERLAMTIALVLAGAALLLAAVGLYGAMSHAVGQRTREIGVRVALGAVPRDVRRLVLRQGLVMAALGSVAGIALALWLAGLIEHLLFGVRPADVTSLAASMLVLAAVAVVATWVPARRATRIDPVVALRD
jgi:predicted lysophospholipase L1 biosynthesis ABC-type transport system permease subunit